MSKISQYINEVKGEVSKVSWPRRDELFEASWVVLFICVAFGLFVFFFDILVSRLLEFIF